MTEKSLAKKKPIDHFFDQLAQLSSIFNEKLKLMIKNNFLDYDINDIEQLSEKYKNDITILYFNFFRKKYNICLKK
jgi:hypothetical protein